MSTATVAAGLLWVVGSAGCASSSGTSSQAPALDLSSTQALTPPTPLPAVARGETCGDVEVTIDRGGLLPPLRYEFAAEGASQIAGDPYTVETRVADYNAQLCWVAVRVTRVSDGAVGDLVLRTPVERTVTYADTQSLFGSGASSPNLKDPFGRRSAARTQAADTGMPGGEEVTLSSLRSTKPTNGISSPDLRDPFGRGDRTRHRSLSSADALSVVVTVHRLSAA